MMELLAAIFAKSSILDVWLGFKYVSAKDSKYAVNFKLTQICVFIKTSATKKVTTLI